MAKLNIIDRRPNPKGKSLPNQQRFLRRAREEVGEAVRRTIADSSIGDLKKDRKVTISGKSTKQPRFILDPSAGGERDFVLPGNKKHMPGDTLPKPKNGGGGPGQNGSPDGEGMDDFEFTLLGKDILDIFFDDMELPNLQRKTLDGSDKFEWKRAGIATSGSPTQINIIRTMRNSQGRRIALKRPKSEEIRNLEGEIADYEKGPEADPDRLAELKARLEMLERRRKLVPFIDPIDVRFNAFHEKPVPVSKAVMFCLMDVSESMGEREKDLAKRFFMLLNLFLERHYERTDLVFIRHTQKAQEVKEHEFFHSKESGGTVVSSALQKMLDISKTRYGSGDWNIYGAQASDGGNYDDDNLLCANLLTHSVVPMAQHFAYMEICSEKEGVTDGHPTYPSMLWRTYAGALTRAPSMNKSFAMRGAAEHKHIPQALHSLFAKAQPGQPGMR